MLTLMPARFIAWVARTASTISVPATKRPERRRPRDERSAKARSDEFSERRTKKVLNIPHLENYQPIPAGVEGRGAPEDVSHRGPVTVGPPLGTTLFTNELSGLTCRALPETFRLRSLPCSRCRQP